MQLHQGWEFTLLLEIAVYKRVTWANRSCHFLKKSDMSDSLCRSQKNEQFGQKIIIFYHIFDSFSLLFPFLCPRVNHSQHTLLRRSLLCSSFLKSNGSNSLLKLFTKERPWAIRSCRSLKKEQPRVNCYFTLSLTNNKRFVWKTKERIPNTEIHHEMACKKSPVWNNDMKFKTP